MSTLREITGRYLEVSEMANDPDIPSEAIRDTLEGIDGEFNDKAINVVHVIQNMGSDVAAIDDEIKRLQDRKKVIKNGEDSLRDYLRFNMESTGISKIECPLFAITLAKGRDVAIVDDENQLAPEYVVTTTRPDKAAILRALKDGPVDGAHIEKSKPSLRIK